ncbi:MAG: hypothetical protein J6C64_05310 [Lachnospiraceae bacterium]|nr:hypothetical protein [Lachnospiraceae bacterium]
MKKLLKISGGILGLVLVACVLWGFQINNEVNEAGIEGNSIHFKTPGFMIRIMCGSPDDILQDNETGIKKYTYNNQTLFGQQGSISYQCLLGVNEVQVTIPAEEQSGEQIFRYISEYMCEVYSKKKGYWNEGIIEGEDGTCRHKLGADFGATGMTYGLNMQIVKSVSRQITSIKSGSHFMK